jgi:hypothetical protein
MARGPRGAGGVVAGGMSPAPRGDMPLFLRHEWTCPSGYSLPCGLAPSRGPALGMSPGPFTFLRTCPPLQVRDGHVLRSPRGPGDMSLSAGQGWTYGCYVHPPGPEQGMSHGGFGVQWTCPLAHASSAYVPLSNQYPCCGPMKDMSLGTLEPQRACPVERSKPSEHVPRRGPRMGTLAICPSLGAREGHVPWSAALCPSLGVSGGHVPRSARNPQSMSLGAGYEWAHRHHVHPRGQ